MRLLSFIFLIFFSQFILAEEIPVFLSNQTPFNITVSLPENMMHTPITLTGNRIVPGFTNQIIANALVDEKNNYHFGVLITVGDGEKYFGRNTEIVNMISYIVSDNNSILRYKDDENEMNTLEIKSGESTKSHRFIILVS